MNNIKEYFDKWINAIESNNYNVSISQNKANIIQNGRSDNIA